MEKWYTLEKETVINKLRSSEEGLTKQEAEERLKKNGYNKLKEGKKKGKIAKFIDQFKNVMIIVLLIAAILSAVVSVMEHEPLTDTIIILVVVVLNALLGVVQESKAEKAIEALKDMSSPYIKVKRGGKVDSIKVEELVQGDIVLLEAGDSVPADMRILENHSLRIEESALTGESVPVDKEEGVLNASGDIPIGDRTNMAYSGSSVVYGRGIAIVTATGMDTELGKIAQAITSMESEVTPLQKKMNEISKILSILVVVIAIIMFIVGLVEGKAILDVFMLAIALAVAAIPEGLAAVITITLAIGVQKMAKEKSIVRKLSAVEALGSTEVICSDKTGTLTQNKMTVRKVYINNTIYEAETVTNKDSKALSVIAKLFTLCNDTRVNEDGKVAKYLGDPTETALIAFGEKIGINKEQWDKEYPRIEELPFDSVRKMMTTVHQIEKEVWVCTKGAIESVLAACQYIQIGDEIKELDEKMKQSIIQTNLELAKQALRVLGYGYKVVDETVVQDKEGLKGLESKLIFVGMTGMIDPPRPEAKQAVQECFEAGMVPVMITGDNIDTAVAIAKELGIIQNEKQAITGTMLDAMSDEELFRQVESIRVYARVSPENKIRIVKAWKKKGRTVAMTGDGVNDAPALKGADIGIGMGITGTEVSKSVSSMVLADDNFATIVVAIKEGRRIYTNIQNVIVYLLASNLAEVLIIFLSTLFNTTLLVPIQILWINLVTDTIPAIALGFEKDEPDSMKQKPRKSNENFFTPYLLSRIIVPAVLKTVIVFVLYFVIQKLYNTAFAMGAVFLTLATIEILFCFICRSDKKSVFKIGLFSNKPIILAVIGTLIVQYLMMCIPLTRGWLKVDNLPLELYGIVALVALISIGVLECVKLILAKVFGKDKIKA